MLIILSRHWNSYLRISNWNTKHFKAIFYFSKPTHTLIRRLSSKMVISLYTISLSFLWDMVCMRCFLILSLLNNFTNNSKCNNLLHHCLLNVSSFPFLHDVIKCTNKSKTLMVFLSNSVLLSLKNQTNGVNRIVNLIDSYLFFPVRVWMTFHQAT